MTTKHLTIADLAESLESLEEAILEAESAHDDAQGAKPEDRDDAMEDAASALAKLEPLRARAAAATDAIREDYEEAWAALNRM